MELSAQRSRAVRGAYQRRRVWMCAQQRPLEDVQVHGHVLGHGRGVAQPKVDHGLALVVESVQSV